MPDKNYRYRVDPLHIKMTEGQDSPSGGKMGSAMDYIGELAQSSHFKLNLFLTGQGTGGADDDLNTWLKSCGLYGNDANDDRLKYDLLCHQAQLPGTQFDLATERGGFQGVTETFARSRQFTQFAVSFYVDTNYHIIRVFEEWMNFINPLHTTQGKVKSGSPRGSLYFDDAQDTHNYFRMRYPEDYKKNIAVTKFERNAGYLRQAGVTGTNNSPQFVEEYSKQLTYQFINAFPIQIAAVDMSYGGSEIVKVDIVFNYDRYTTMKHDPYSNVGGDTKLTGDNIQPVTENSIPQ